MKSLKQKTRWSRIRDHICSSFPGSREKTHFQPNSGSNAPLPIPPSFRVNEQNPADPNQETGTLIESIDGSEKPGFSSYLDFDDVTTDRMVMSRRIGILGRLDPDSPFSHSAWLAVLVFVLSRQFSPIFCVNGTRWLRKKLSAPVNRSQSTPQR